MTTAVTVNRKPIFEEPKSADMVLETILFGRKKKWYQEFYTSGNSRNFGTRKGMQELSKSWELRLREFLNSIFGSWEKRSL